MNIPDRLRSSPSFLGLRPIGTDCEDVDVDRPFRGYHVGKLLHASEPTRGILRANTILFPVEPFHFGANTERSSLPQRARRQGDDRPLNLLRLAIVTFAA